MSRIFISYRHEDAQADAGRLYETLAAELGQEALYKDVESIAIGSNWKRAVREALADSAAALFVMGPAWRLSPAIEFELELTIGSDIPVVPILVRQADLALLTAGLPAPLSRISERKAVTLSHASWSRDCRELLEMLKRVLADPARARVLIAPPEPRVLLDEANWPGMNDRNRLLTFAQDLAECLCDPEVRSRAEAAYERFDGEMLEAQRSRYDMSPSLVREARIGLKRLSVEQYVRDLLRWCPPEHDWKAVAATVASLGELAGDPAIGARAWSEFEDMQAELRALSRSRGDGGDPEIIHGCQAALRTMVPEAKARLVEAVPGIDQPGFTKRYPDREWPAAAFGKTMQFGRWS